MNIKSLLLGSAAALVAVTGARAADAIVIAEPEPVEYVRICDAYGAGFFYIPGTETCLKFDGYVQMQIATDSDDDEWNVSTRGRLNVDSRSDTEWGTLRGYMRLQGSNTSNSASDAEVTVAVVQLGGFYAGLAESAWFAPWGLPGISRFGIIGTDAGGNATPDAVSRQQIGYTFSGGNGVFGSIVLEDDEGSGDGYMPDVVGVLGISQGWGGVWAKVGYDESAEDFGVVLGMQYNIPNMSGSAIRAGVFYASGFNNYAIDMPVSGATVEWSAAASYSHRFNPQLVAAIGGQYFEQMSTGHNGYLVEGAVVWTPVTNFEVWFEARYADEDFEGDFSSGFIRFRRYF